MKFYAFDEIRAAGDCAALATAVFGAHVNRGRCNAAWRGGDNPEAVAIDNAQWYDHVQKEGGGIIELAAFKFAGDVQAAQEFLGEYYHLTPKRQTGAQPETECRHLRLLRDGYVEKARYEYRDVSGAVRHITVRMEHPDQSGKQFVQGAPDKSGKIRWSLKGVDTILYRQPEVSASPLVIICEGEKSADRLSAMGLPSTTAPMGAGKWRDEYTAALAGKHVAIAPDNDEPGREHALTVARALHGHAASVKIIGPLSSRPAGGIDDWLDEAPGRDSASVIAEIDAAPAWTPGSAGAAEIAETSTAGTGITETQLAEAKKANAIPFRNYIPEEVESEKRGKKVKDTIKKPRTHAAMLDDLGRRFLGFPRRVGESYLFDHDRDSGQIIEIHSAETLLSWIGRRSKHNPEFTRGDGFVNPREFLESIKAEAPRYESISETPDYPRRTDVYYSHGAIPEPCPNHSRFNRFVDFFLPATPADRTLISALVCSPLWFIPGIDRPAWVVDSRDGQGSGKTNLAELIADLYNAAPISTTKYELTNRIDVLVKRILSGRKARILLVDNITGEFQSPELADIITRKNITGIAPYGRSEEVRRNNLTVIITANTATVGSDIADRSIYIHLRKPDQTMDRTGWKAAVQFYIAQHRLEIVADIIDLLSHHTPLKKAPQTRFAAWEVAILQPCCRTPEAYSAALDAIRTAREESNVEHDQARAVIDHFSAQIAAILQYDVTRPVFIRSDVVNSWGRIALNDALGADFKGLPIQIVRNLAKVGLIPQIDREIRRFPNSGHGTIRASGIAWNFTDATESATMISRDGSGGYKTEVIQ